jgi:hypothetical protein
MTLFNHLILENDCDKFDCGRTSVFMLDYNLCICHNVDCCLMCVVVTVQYCLVRAWSNSVIKALVTLL